MKINSIVVLCLSVLLSIPAIGTDSLNKIEDNSVLVPEIEGNEILIEENAVSVSLKEDLFNQYIPEIFEPAKKNIDTNNMVFVGNSLVEGLRMYSNSNNSFLAKVGISLEGLKYKHYKQLNGYSCETVVIGMGTNELGSYSKEDFISSYKDLVNHIRSINHESNIICLSIPPVTQKKSNSDSKFNNTNVEIYNRYIKELCNTEKLIYLDNEPFFGTVLDSKWSGDGIHLKGNIYREWYNYIIKMIADM